MSNATNWMLGLLLVAVVVVIGLLAVLVFTDDQPAADSTTTTSSALASTTTTGESTTSSATSSTTAAPSSTTSEASSTTSTSTVARPDVRNAEEAAEAYIAALGSGDTATGWVLLAPEAQAAVGSFDAFDDLATAFVEGFGGWRRATDVTVYENVMTRTFVGDITVVTYAGEVTREGITELGTLAVPVRGEGDGPYDVMWFFPEERVEFAVPEVTDPPASFPADGTFEILVPETVTFVKFAVDDLGEFEGLSDPPRRGTARVTASPNTDLAPGLHALTVLTIDGDFVVADAVAFVVE
jgi:hypothetical protein